MNTQFQQEKGRVERKEELVLAVFPRGTTDEEISRIGVQPLHVVTQGLEITLLTKFNPAKYTWALVSSRWYPVSLSAIHNIDRPETQIFDEIACYQDMVWQWCNAHGYTILSSNNWWDSTGGKKELNVVKDGIFYRENI